MAPYSINGQHSYYKVNQLLLVDLFLIGFNIPVARVGRTGARGSDPGVYSSGKFTATTNRITKRGSSRLRHALYLAVLCGIRSSRNKKLKEFYDKKKSEGKPAKVAIVACINKLLHWIYALLNRKESFLDIA